MAATIDHSLPHLLVIAHGSRSQTWAGAIDGLVAQMAACPALTQAFSAVGVAFLDHSLPSVEDTLSRLGPRPIVALPLFLTRSGHIADDLPVAIRGRARVLDPLDPLRWLPDNVSARLGASQPGRGCVLVAYGSGPYRRRWDALLEGVCATLRGRGVESGFAYVGHLVGFSPQPTVDAVVELARSNPQLSEVHVMPVLFSQGALQRGPIAEAAALAATRLRSPHSPAVRYAADALLPDPSLARALVRHAVNAVVPHHSVKP